MKHHFTASDLPRLHGKTAVITGANAGLGLETARQLAAHGADVVIACRSLDKAQQAIQSIKHTEPTAEISSVQLDLADLASIQQAAEQLLELEKIDLLINNAGVMTPPFSLTKDGFESQFGVNHLGPFALTGMLLAKLNATPNARVINTSSLAALNGRINFADINAANGYNAMRRYSMSKLANLLYSSELDRRLKTHELDTISVACHPGIADTELSRHLPAAFKLALPLVKVFFNSSAQGAWPTLMAATDAKASGGEYYGPSRFNQTSGPAKKIATPRIKNAQATAERLWQVSEQMTGVHYAFS